jgi:hypothetical protein
MLAQVPGVDVAQLFDFATKAGAMGALVIWLWMMLTDRLHTAKRVEEAHRRTELAEKQRDDAMQIAREQTAAVKELAEAQESALDWMRSALSGRSGLK